jgi:hypothetical protein
MRGEQVARAKYSHVYYDNVKSLVCDPGEPIPDEAGRRRLSGRRPAAEGQTPKNRLKRITQRE